MKKPHPHEFNRLLTDELLQNISISILEVNDSCEKATNTPLDDTSGKGYLRYIRLKNNLLLDPLFVKAGFKIQMKNHRVSMSTGDQEIFIDSSIRDKTTQKVYKLLQEQPSLDFGTNNSDSLCVGAFKLFPAINADSEAYVKFLGYNPYGVLITEWVSTDHVTSLRTLDDDLPEPRNITSPSLEDLDKLNSEQDDDDLKTNDLNENG